MITSRAIPMVAIVVGVSLGHASTTGATEAPAGGTGVTVVVDGSDPQREGEPVVNKEILALIRTYQRGLNEANVDLVKSVFADDAIFIGQPFPTATGIVEIAALYSRFLSTLDFSVEFEILEVELGEDLGFVRTRSHGTIVPKGQTPPGGPEGNREVFVVKKIGGAWKIYRYIFNAEV